MKAPLLALAMASASLAGSLAFAQSANPPVKSAPLPQPGPPGPPRTGDFVWPERIANAKVLPADIGAERLRRTMVSFSRSLGVRCTHCHVGAEGAPLSQLDFASDANPHKEVARGMLRLVQRLNGQDMPAMLGPAEQPRVTCFTCHRGEAEPATMVPPAEGTSPPAQPQPPREPHTHDGERGHH